MENPEKFEFGGLEEPERLSSEERGKLGESEESLPLEEKDKIIEEKYLERIRKKIEQIKKLEDVKKLKQAKELKHYLKGDIKSMETVCKSKKLRQEFERAFGKEEKKPEEKVKYLSPEEKAKGPESVKYLDPEETKKLEQARKETEDAFKKPEDKTPYIG